MNCLSRPTAIRLLSAQFSTRLVHCCSVQGAQRHASSSDHRPLPYSWRRSQYAEQRAAFGDGKVPRALRSRYELFYDRGEEVIDSDRAVWMQYDRHAPPSTMSNDGETTAGASVDESDFKGLDLSRGAEGVFDIDEICAILTGENAIDICCIQVPPDKPIADWIVLVSARSLRHLAAVAAFMNRLYKRKKLMEDPFIRREGVDTDWIAMDFGNIMLHLFLPESRERYDIEGLWCLGEEHDDALRQQHPLSAIMQEYTLVDEVDGEEAHDEERSHDFPEQYEYEADDEPIRRAHEGSNERP